MDNGSWVAFLVPIATVLAVFTFVSIASWAEERRKERVAAYRMELLKKMVDQPGTNPQMVLDFIKEEERVAAVRRREGLKLGGLVTAASGLGVAVLLYGIARGKPIWLVGLIPLLIGAVLLLYVRFMAPRP